MADGIKTPGAATPPSLAELMARFLHNQAAGLAPAEAGEVVPFEAAPVQPVDAKLAWDEAQTALDLLHPHPGKRGKADQLAAPPEWASLVASHEPEFALAFCTGNFPQLVRNFHPLLHADRLPDLRPTAARASSHPLLEDWAAAVARKKEYPQALVAAGCLRLAGQFDRAQQFFLADRGEVPAEWRAAWENERAALAWHAGRWDEAAALWEGQPASVPVLFNRGMAALFLGRAADARPSLTEAVGRLPEDGAWHHLGRLYLALADDVR